MDAIYSSLWPRKPLYQLTFSQKRLLVQIIDALGCPLLNCYLNKSPIDSQELNEIIDQLINKLPVSQLQQLQNSNKLRRQSTKLTFFSFKLIHNRMLKKPLNKHKKAKNKVY